MFHVRDVLQLREGERIEAILRRHMIDIWPKLILSGALIVLPFFFLFALAQMGAFGILLFCLIVGTGLYLALRTLILWDAQVLLVTNRRLIHVDQKGIWQRVVSETPLSEIRSVESRRSGILDALFRTGTLKVLSTVSSAGIEFPRIPRPNLVTAKIGDLRRDENR